MEHPHSEITVERLPPSTPLPAFSPPADAEPPPKNYVEINLGRSAAWPALLLAFLCGLLFGGAGGYVGALWQDTGAPAELAAEPGNAALAANQPAAQQETSAGTNPEAPTIMEYVASQTRHFRGDPNAPVTIIEFSDFQCPYCVRFSNSTALQINTEYVASGAVRIGYQHMAFLGPDSVTAAQASECAADQGAFWEYHDVLFQMPAGGARKPLDAGSLKQYAADLGLDTEAFAQCLDSGKYASLVQQQSVNAQSMGIRGTPAFLINGQPLVGAQPFEVFQQVIETHLAQASR